jgi:hypothetical protein
VEAAEKVTAGREGKVSVRSRPPGVIVWEAIMYPEEEGRMVAVKVVEGRAMRVLVGSFAGRLGVAGMFAAGLFTGVGELLLSGGLGVAGVLTGGEGLL